MDTAAPRPIRRLPFGAEPADRQLASGLALLAGLEEGARLALRWTEISPPALILGSSERLDDANFDACAARGVLVYRRASGGGAVLTEASLALDVAVPPGDPLDVDDVTASYRWLGETWALALARLGVEARVISVAEARADAPTLPPLLKRACFGGLSPFEVVVGPRKIVGLAQRRRRSGALLQAGVYLQWSSDRTAELLTQTSADRAALTEMLDGRVAGLNTVGLGGLDGAAVMAAVEAVLSERWGLVPTDDDWTPAERAARDEARGRFQPLN